MASTKSIRFTYVVQGVAAEIVIPFQSTETFHLDTLFFLAIDNSVVWFAILPVGERYLAVIIPIICAISFQSIPRSPETYFTLP